MFCLDDTIVTDLMHKEKIDHVQEHYEQWLKMTGFKSSKSRKDAFAAGMHCEASNIARNLKNRGLKPANDPPHCVYCDEPVEGVIIVHPQCAEEHKFKCRECGASQREALRGVCDSCELEYRYEDLS